MQAYRLTTVPAKTNDTTEEEPHLCSKGNYSKPKLRMAEVIRNQPFVNWAGGKSRNIDDYTAIEICNCITKNMVREMAANKTEQAIERATKAAVGVKDMISNYDKVSAITPNSGKHTTRKSTQNEQGMIRVLRGLRPFRKIAGRRHASFPAIDRTAISNIDMEIYHRWISKHVNQLTSAL